MICYFCVVQIGRVEGLIDQANAVSYEEQQKLEKNYQTQHAAAQAVFDLAQNRHVVHRNE